MGIIAAAIGGWSSTDSETDLKTDLPLSNLSERMSNLDFEAKYEPEKHEMEEIQVLGNSMNHAVRTPGRDDLRTEIRK